uniref:Uncharacterized protein n=1 Tax=Arundo donax TaxID=35708 RepID=A0A0A8ZU72_ARUDO
MQCCRSLMEMLQCKITC